MKLTALTEALPYCLWQGTMEKDVTALIYFSEEAVPGSVFFAMAGAKQDGWDYARDAVSRGAHVVVTEKIGWPGAGVQAHDLPEQVTVLLVEDVARTMAMMSGAFYGWPLRQMKTIGVTGTKGKTSTTFMIREILESWGVKTGMIGTVQNGYEDHFSPAERTTPESCDIQRWCRQMVDGGCEAVVIEVSSQGLKRGRVDGIIFDLAVFTNLSPDHIGQGEHEDFEEYSSWKRSLFSRCKRALLNRDDPYWQDMIPADNPPEIFTFGESEEADFCMKEDALWRREGELGISFGIEEKGDKDAQEPQEELSMALPGRFNASNGTGAAAAARILGAPWEAVRRGLMSVRVPGRVESVSGCGPFTVLVDYAHNGVALRSLLKDLRVYDPARLVVVFGCGGGRDKNRRREMGRAAAQMADLIIVTSDNPREERPMDIIGDITEAIEEEDGRCLYQVIEDRQTAIEYAIAHGEKGDIILIAGKGHETYQIIGRQKRHFDDRQVVRNIALKRRGKAGQADEAERAGEASETRPVKEPGLASEAVLAKEAEPEKEQAAEFTKSGNRG